MSRLALTAVAIHIYGCAVSLPIAGQDTITADYAHGGGSWTSGGGITAVARIVDRSGEAALCGAWMTDRQSVLSAGYNERVMAAGSVFAGGERVASNLTFMRRHPWSDSLIGKPADCVATGRPWSPALSAAPVRIRLPRMTFGAGWGGAGIGGVGPGSGDRTTFRQTPRQNPLR